MKSLRLYLIVAGVLLTLYIVAEFNRPKTVDWSATFISKEKTPFGTYILNNRLRDIFPKSKVVRYRQAVYNVIAEDSIENSSYLIICPGIDLSKADYGQLINYIKKGNDVFIAADFFGKSFEKNLKLYSELDFTFGKDTTAIKFVSPALDSSKIYAVDKGAGNIYFAKFDTLRATVIGETKAHKADFIKYSFGKGSLYLSCNPKMFTNYSLLKPQGAAYAATALSFLNGTPKIAVDDYYSQGDDEKDSPMRLFLSHPPLEWAYYITIFGLLIFILFEMKRRQRVIPVIEPLQNSTLDFVTVVGQVYYEKRDNANIAEKKIRYFFTFLRDEYQIKTTKLDTEFVEKLTAKLNLERHFVNELVEYIKYIANQQQVTDGELIELNKLIEQFYIKSR